MKLFEYMASGTPIIASDVPSLREVLSVESAVWVCPDDSEELASMISRIFTDGESGTKYAQSALEEVSNYTWEKRAREVLRRINGRA